MAATGLTLFEKIWRRHVVTEGPGGQSLLYVDRHLLHEGSTHAFGRMERKGLAVRRPEACLATADHYVPTASGRGEIADPEVRRMVADLGRHTERLGITFFGRPYDEATLIKLAYAYEQATHHRVPPKTTPALTK